MSSVNNNAVGQYTQWMGNLATNPKTKGLISLNKFLNKKEMSSFKEENGNFEITFKSPYLGTMSNERYSQTAEIKTEEVVKGTIDKTGKMHITSGITIKALGMTVPVCELVSKVETKNGKEKTGVNVTVTKTIPVVKKKIQITQFVTQGTVDESAVEWKKA